MLTRYNCSCKRVNRIDIMRWQRRSGMSQYIVTCQAYPAITFYCQPSYNSCYKTIRKGVVSIGWDFLWCRPHLTGMWQYMNLLFCWHFQLQSFLHSYWENPMSPISQNEDREYWMHTLSMCLLLFDYTVPGGVLPWRGAYFPDFTVLSSRRGTLDLRVHWL